MVWLLVESEQPEWLQLESAFKNYSHTLADDYRYQSFICCKLYQNGFNNVLMEIFFYEIIYLHISSYLLFC